MSNTILLQHRTGVRAFRQVGTICKPVPIFNSLIEARLPGPSIMGRADRPQMIVHPRGDLAAGRYNGRFTMGGPAGSRPKLSLREFRSVPAT